MQKWKGLCGVYSSSSASTMSDGDSWYTACHDCASVGLTCEGLKCSSGLLIKNKNSFDVFFSFFSVCAIQLPNIIHCPITSNSHGGGIIWVPERGQLSQITRSIKKQPRHLSCTTEAAALELNSAWLYVVWSIGLRSSPICCINKFILFHVMFSWIF